MPARFAAVLFRRAKDVQSAPYLLISYFLPSERRREAWSMIGSVGSGPIMLQPFCGSGVSV
jgi:hypothetical protein